MELTGVRVDVEAGRHPVSVHDAVLHLSVDPHVGVVGLDPQNQSPRRLVLQNHRVQTVVRTLREQITQSEQNHNKLQGYFLAAGY